MMGCLLKLWIKCEETNPPPMQRAIPLWVQHFLMAA